MSLMLPSMPAGVRSIVGVADDLFAALGDGRGGLPPARSVVLVVVDGLGAHALRAHAGHARSLNRVMGKKDTAQTVIPTTTATALTSILTGAWPGQHGLVGYRVLDRRRDVLINQLSGWERSGADPADWQLAPTVFERAAAEQRAGFAVGLAEYARSGFTQATLRGSNFLSASDPAERVQIAYEAASAHPGSVAYCYLPEIDKAGHAAGMSSDAWLHALEGVDAALSARVPDGVGVLVTADHGMIDVPSHRQVVLEHGDARLEGIRHFGGEPRMLHLYLEPDESPIAQAERWRALSGDSAYVITRQEAIDARVFGPVVTGDAASRIGDLIVMARGNRAFYDGTAEDQKSRRMIGQHGSITPEERTVPYLRMGAFERT